MLQASTEVVVRRRLQPGTQVGNHLVIRSVLGSGGTAVVYEALHTRLDTAVALKVAHVSTASDDDAVARLDREARVCAGIEDPRVPRVYDVGELDDGRPYLVMQKISGQTLEEIVAGQRLSPSMALRITRELLSALDAVHRHGVVHRDIKPSNVIARFEDEGYPRVHLMDFGVSKEIAARPSEPALTRPGAIVGTPLYMAPEQMAGDPIDARADLYAVGVLLYEMLSGRAPFVGGSTSEIMAAVLRRDHPSLAQAWPGAPRELVTLVSCAMAERAADRFTSARQMRDALDQVMYVVEPPAIRTSLAPSLPPRAYSRVKLGVLALCGLCAVVVGSSVKTAGSHDIPRLSARATAHVPAPAGAAKVAPREAEAPASMPALAQKPAALPAVPVATAQAPAPRPRAQQRPAQVAKKPLARPVVRPGIETRAPSADHLVADSLRELEALRSGLDVSAVSGVSSHANPEQALVD
jgi:serine/threonine protein kinase